MIDLNSLSPDKMYFSSDFHFGHARVILYDSRPFTHVGHMNDTMIDSINSTVPEDGVLFILGDMCFGGSNYIKTVCSRLKCKKVLILGNHDRSKKFYDETGEFLLVTKSFVTVIDGKTYFMSHHPTDDDGGADIHLCGHVHVAWIKKDNKINAGCCVWDYVPKTLTEILRDADIKQSLHVPVKYEQNQ